MEDPVRPHSFPFLTGHTLRAYSDSVYLWKELRYMRDRPPKNPGDVVFVWSRHLDNFIK